MPFIKVKLQPVWIIIIMVHCIECLFEVKGGLRKKLRNNQVTLEGFTFKREHEIDILNRLVNYVSLQFFPIIGSILHASAFFSAIGWDTAPPF